MDAETRIALAALIIGLSALLITTGQLLQQVCGTADGYRRCQSSVIGPWARRTRRVWLWSQFRMETKFTTPEIVLIDLDQSDHRLADAKAFSGSSAASNQIIDLNSRELPIELRETIDICEGMSDHSTNGDLVSWTSFIRQLSLLVRMHPPRSIHVSRQRPGIHCMQSPYSSVGVIYQERTWDLMPTDILRPVASSRLGTIIILAMHLGMRWKNLEMSNGILRAEGNGHVLISSMVQGFGIVFNYSFNPSFQRILSEWISNGALYQGEQSRSLSRNADKLACGIIPGTSLFNVCDIALRGKDSEETSFLLSEAVNGLGARQQIVEALAEVETVQHMTRHGPHNKLSFPINDMICVLTPFLPQEGSTNTFFTYPLQTTVPLSVFLFWETREILLHKLRDHPERHPSNRPHLQEIYERMLHLSQKYEKDFYCRWNNSVCRGRNVPAATTLEFLQTLRETHMFTTTYFERQKSRISFVSLVAGHITLAGAASLANAHLLRNPDEVSKFWIATAKWYISGKGLSLLHAEVLPKLLQSDGQDLDKQLVEDAWWTLVLRGIAWRMSVRDLRGQMIVQSRLYYDQTPVYFL